MLQVLIAIIENAHVEFERTEKGWRLSGKGPLGILALYAIAVVVLAWVVGWL